MSTKSNKSTTSTKNSFGVLSLLEDSQDLKTPNKGSQKAVESSPKPSVPVVQVTKPVSNGNGNVTTSNKKDKKAKQAKEAVPKMAANGASTVHKASQTTASSQSSNSLFKMLIFAVLMVVLPLGAYYWSVKQTGFDLGEIKSALVAVLVVNILLFVYIVMAMFESSKEDKKKA